LKTAACCSVKREFSCSAVLKRYTFFLVYFSVTKKVRALQYGFW